MKVLLFSDNHFCTSSSIVRGRGRKFSLRLENQIKSLNWMESVASEKACQMIICLGDFFDKPNLTDEELTALKSIKWNLDIPHYFIVGNHESSVNGLAYNSTKALEQDNFNIIDEPSDIDIDLDFKKVTIHLLPYIIEDNRKPLYEYFQLADKSSVHQHIILSHNDISGIQMGPVLSKQGFNISEIEQSCDLFINGHLHNGTKFCKNGYNLGNLTGQNFSENAFIYKHQIIILDLETLELEFIENPYAFNFYKFEINSEYDLLKFDHIKNNAVLNIKCKDTLLPFCKQLIEDSVYIVNFKLTVSKDATENEKSDLTFESDLDYLKKFIQFCHENINNTAVLETELQEICK